MSILVVAKFNRISLHLTYISQTTRPLNIHWRFKVVVKSDGILVISWFNVECQDTTEAQNPQTSNPLNYPILKVYFRKNKQMVLK